VESTSKRTLTRAEQKNVAVHIFYKQDAVMVKDKRSTEKKWNPPAKKH